MGDGEIPQHKLKELGIICRAIIHQQKKLFGELPQFDPQDLFQESMIVAIKKYQEHDPAKGGTLSVWCGNAVKNRLIDLWRVGSKSKAREKLVASVRSETDISATPHTTPLPDELDYAITHLPSKTLIARCLDADITRLADILANSTDSELTTGLKASTFTLQRLRMALLGSYLPIVIGSRKFTATSFLMSPETP